MYNARWKTKLGVNLTELQALALNLAVDSAGLTVEQVVSATGVTLEDASSILGHLCKQMLMEEQDGRYVLRDHLREMLT